MWRSNAVAALVPVAALSILAHPRWSLATCDQASSRCAADGGDDLASALQIRLRDGAETNLTGDWAGKDKKICQELRDALRSGGLVLCDVEIPTYGWGVYNARCAQKTPRFIVQPASADDVRQAVIITRRHGLSISLRGSGHSYNCNGFRERSVHLDMRFMSKKVTTMVLGGSLHAQLPPGANFYDMMDAIPSNHSFTHGTCFSVGVMAYHLQGGWGPHTAMFANESITAMQVVTASGDLIELDAASKGREAALWDAMRVAGPSFGIVTSLTIRLFPFPERPNVTVPVYNTFAELLELIPFEAPFGWVGIFKWDQFIKNPYGDGFFLQVFLKDGSPDTQAQLEAWLVTSGVKVANNFTRPPPAPVPVGPGTWKHERYPFPDAGLFSRFYQLHEIRGATRLLHEFFRRRAHECRFNYGPLKGAAQLPIITVECNTACAIDELKSFVHENRRVLQPDRPGSGYINLPLDSSAMYRAAYWPQYEQLSAVKRIWDPEDFFYTENGIHPSRRR